MRRGGIGVYERGLGREGREDRVPFSVIVDSAVPLLMMSQQPQWHVVLPVVFIRRHERH